MPERPNPLPWAPPHWEGGTRRSLCNWVVWLAAPHYRVHFNVMKSAFDLATHDDNPPMDAAFLAGMTPSRRGRLKLETPKVEVKIRLDAKTVEHLRGSSPGWQTRVNALLGRMRADGWI